MIYGIPHFRPVDRYGRNRAVCSSKDLERLTHHRLPYPSEELRRAQKDPGALFLAFSSSSWALTIVAEGSISFAYRLPKADLLRLSDEVESFLSVPGYPVKN